MFFIQSRKNARFPAFCFSTETDINFFFNDFCESYNVISRPLLRSAASGRCNRGGPSPVPLLRSRRPSFIMDFFDPQGHSLQLIGLHLFLGNARTTGLLLFKSRYLFTGWKRLVLVFVGFFPGPRRTYCSCMSGWLIFISPIRWVSLCEVGVR